MNKYKEISLNPQFCEFLEEKKWNITVYSQYTAKSGTLINELGLIITALTIHKHVGVLLQGFQWWTTRENGDWTKCEVLFAYRGKMYRSDN